MIRNRLENLAKAQKRPHLDISADQTSESQQNISEQVNNPINISSENDSDENSDPEVQLIQFDIGKTAKEHCVFGMQAFATHVAVEHISVAPTVTAKPLPKLQKNERE
uniref:Uncharacterized protein n=1 Tax=Meloidogyne hapla TaxID=6305 RepID=A0A1I8C1P7_MELHA